MWKKILEEWGYTEPGDNRPATPPKKRGRPRGKFVIILLCTYHSQVT